MALSDLQKLFVVSTATQMWQQDLLMNAYFQGSAVGANLREMVLGRQPVKPLTNPFDEAITGRLRSDSAAIRRAGKNVQEASSMVGIAASAVGAIKGVLEHPELELVGCWVHSPGKAGRDVGEIIGLDPLGVTATDRTPSAWPARVRSSAPLARSQTFSVRSTEAETACRPSGVTATELTPQSRPARVRSSTPLARSQTFSV